MSKFLKSCVLLLFITSSFSNVSAENKWITKKSQKSKEEIKEEKATKTEWIKFNKKEIKKNKKEYKEKEKNISKKVKSWITKKSKKDQWLDINSLPGSQIYFTATSSNKRIFYGYIDDDKSSELLKVSNASFYKFSNGMAFINDGKTTCRIATERVAMSSGRIILDLSGECTDKTKFTGQYNQKNGSGTAETAQKEGITFKFNPSLLIAKNLKKNLEKEFSSQVASASPPLPRTSIEVKPTGNYYALLIGNSKYTNWSSLVSPVNDINEIEKVLKNKYTFKKVFKQTNATREQIFTSLKKLRNVSTDNDYVLIYYAGHGDKDSSSAYWIPVDGEREMDHRWVNAETIKYEITKIKAKHILLMVDSCYIGTSIKGKSDKDFSDFNFNASEANIMLNNRAGLVIASGGDQPVSDVDIDDKHSLFAWKFIDILKKNENFIVSQNIFLQIRKTLIAHQIQNPNKEIQTPTTYEVPEWKHLNGDFVFKVKK
jgi:hypothetical protein